MANKVIQTLRLVDDPVIRYSQGDNPRCIAKYRGAVQREYAKDGEQSADFFNYTAFGKDGEFVEKYLRKGMKILIEGRLQSGSYTDKDGKKVYTTDIVVSRHEFLEKKNSEIAATAPDPANQSAAAEDGFMNIPDGIDEELPFA